MALPLYLGTDMAKNAPICTVRKAVWTTGEDQFLSGQIDILMTDRHER